LAGRATAPGTMRVTFDSLKSYVCETVNRYCSRHNMPPQNPVFIYLRRDDRRPLAKGSLSVQSGPPDLTDDAEPLIRRPIKPGIIVTLPETRMRTDGSQERSRIAQSRIQGMLTEDGFPVIADEAAESFLAQLSGENRETAALQAERLNASYLFRGRVRT